MIYKRGRGFELGTTENKTSKWRERDSSPGLPDCKSNALTTRPRCLRETEMRYHGWENLMSIKNVGCHGPKERPYPRNTGGKWKHDALTKTSAWESSLSGLEAEPMSRYLLPFKNAKTCLQSLSISKNNGLVSVFKTIFRHWNCFLSAVASDGRDGHGLKL